MDNQKVTLFTPYPFHEGQKINIQEGPRKGDWEVVGITERKVTLRCPISQKEFQWNRFCYAVNELTDAKWPNED